MPYPSVFDNDFLNAQRMVCDPPAEAFIQQVFENAPQKQVLFQKLNTFNYNEQISGLADFYHGNDFINEAAMLPQWADAKLMAKGSTFFARHAEAIMNLLGLL